MAPDARKTIVFCCFQDGWHGRREPDWRCHGPLTWPGWPVRAPAFDLATLSAHADGGEIVAWLRHFKRAPQETLITHGEHSQLGLSFSPTIGGRGRRVDQAARRRRHAAGQPQGGRFRRAGCGRGQARHALLAQPRPRCLMEPRLPHNANMLRLVHECSCELGAINSDGILLMLPLRTE